MTPYDEDLPELTVTVSRTGGIAGVRHTGEVRLGEDPRSSEVERLLAVIDLSRLKPTTVWVPDRFVYGIRIGRQSITLGEQDLTPELEQLVRVVLDGPSADVR